MNKHKQNPSRRQSCADMGKLLEPRFFKALSDPNRIALLSRLAKCRQPCGVSELVGCCGVDISVVSRHLALLRDAGILRAEKRGKEVYYSVRCEEVVSTLRRIADAIEACCPKTKATRGERP